MTYKALMIFEIAQCEPSLRPQTKQEHKSVTKRKPTKRKTTKYKPRKYSDPNKHLL